MCGLHRVRHPIFFSYGKNIHMPLTQELPSLLLRSRALVNTNHQAIKLQRRLDGCDGLLVSCWLRVYCPSDQEVDLRNRRRVQGRLNT
jgi:hypothetical protein